MRLLDVIAAGLVATGCSSSSDVDLGGVFRVDSDLASMPCGTDQSPAMPAVYVTFTKDDVFGAAIWGLNTCTDAAGSDCTADANAPFGMFSEPTDNGWNGNDSSSSFSGGICELAYDDNMLTLMGSALVVELHHYADSPPLTEAQCTADEAKQRGTSMPCEQHERIAGTKL